MKARIELLTDKAIPKAWFFYFSKSRPQVRLFVGSPRTDWRNLWFRKTAFIMVTDKTRHHWAQKDRDLVDSLSDWAKNLENGKHLFSWAGPAPYRGWTRTWPNGSGQSDVDRPTTVRVVWWSTCMSVVLSVYQMETEQSDFIRNSVLVSHVI